jgi:hypothetical protein
MFRKKKLNMLYIIYMQWKEKLAVVIIFLGLISIVQTKGHRS